MQQRTSTDERVVQQPLHPSVRPLLDPQYVAFHDSTLQYIVPSQLVPWHADQRLGPGMGGGSPLREVGKTQDFDLAGGAFSVRVFTPKGAKPQHGWPVFIWLHGGGWTLGGGSEHNFCTAASVRAQCVTIAVDYRLAPEHPWPAAVDDSVATLEWVRDEGAKLLGVNTTRIAIGGSSAGGNLSAVLALRAASLNPPVPLVFQLLNVPVIDNTLTSQGLWSEKALTAPWLTPDRMLWYRAKYIPNERNWSHPDASPNLASASVLQEAPATFIGVAEQDLLSTEAIAFAKQLENLGVAVELKVYKGATHSMVSLDGILDVGKQAVIDETEALAKAFGTF